MTGLCGRNTKWCWKRGTLTVEPIVKQITGQMDDYSKEYEQPWWGYDIQKVVVKKGITHIGDYAFFGYEDLSKVKLHEGLFSIGEYAFAHCYSLRKLDLPDSLTSVWKRAFIGCRGLKYLSLPETIRIVAKDAFQDCPVDKLLREQGF